MASVLGKRKARSVVPSTTATTSSKKAKKTSGSGSSSAGLVAKKPSAAALKKKKKTTAVRQRAREDENDKEEQEEDDAVAHAQEVFRRHFETAFKPLPSSETKRKKTRVEAEAEGGGHDGVGEEEEYVDEDVEADDEVLENEEWSGLSGDEEDVDSEGNEEEENENPVIEVVDHTKSNRPQVASMSKRELKAFMSSKPPSQTPSNPTTTTTTTPTVPATDDEDDKSHLANDLALQRLLSESHLLARHGASPFSSSSSSSSATTGNNPNSTAASKSFASGKLRQRQLDLRAQNLAPGAKSLFKQEKMPMAVRKGVDAAAAHKEARRRAQARENGVVLERERPDPKKQKQKRSRAERAVDGPAVGRMRGAELRLSERDIQSIEGGGGGGARFGRGGGRGGGGGNRGRGRR